MSITGVFIVLKETKLRFWGFITLQKVQSGPSSVVITPQNSKSDSPVDVLQMRWPSSSSHSTHLGLDFTPSLYYQPTSMHVLPSWDGLWLKKVNLSTGKRLRRHLSSTSCASTESESSTSGGGERPSAQSAPLCQGGCKYISMMQLTCGVLVLLLLPLRCSKLLLCSHG